MIEHDRTCTLCSSWQDINKSIVSIVFWAQISPFMRDVKCQGWSGICTLCVWLGMCVFLIVCIRNICALFCLCMCLHTCLHVVLSCPSCSLHVLLPLFWGSICKQQAEALLPTVDVAKGETFSVAARAVWLCSEKRFWHEAGECMWYIHLPRHHALCLADLSVHDATCQALSNVFSFVRCFWLQKLWTLD